MSAVKVNMADDSDTRKVTILLDGSLIEELRGWLTINSGEIVKVQKPRKKPPALPDRQEEEENEEPPRNSNEHQLEIISAEIESCDPESNQFQQSRFCSFCRNSPCVLDSENLPNRLRAHGQPRMTNHSKRKGDYKTFYTILNRRGLWRDPVYLQRKEALGCYIEDVREVMPVCVVEDVRKRWPNPDGVPYCGHRRS